MKWEWKGRRLAPLHTILRRLVVLPVLMVAHGLVFAAVLVGWGFDAALQAWRGRT